MLVQTDLTAFRNWTPWTGFMDTLSLRLVMQTQVLNSIKTQTEHLSLASNFFIMRICVLTQAAGLRYQYLRYLWGPGPISLVRQLLFFNPVQSCVAPPDSCASGRSINRFSGGKQVDFHLPDWWQSDVLFNLQGPQPLPSPPGRPARGPFNSATSTLKETQPFVMLSVWSARRRSSAPFH